MVSIRIDDSSYAPTMLIADRPNDGGSGCHGPFEKAIRIVHGHHHPDRATTQRLGAKIEVFRRLVGKPELGAFYRQLSDHRATVGIKAEQFYSAKGGLIELDRLRSAANGEHWSDDGLRMADAL